MSEELGNRLAHFLLRRFRIDSFVGWLQSQGKRHWTVKYTKNYAIKYGHILDTGDASALAALSPCNRQHAMSALAALSKYQGRYDKWLQIRQGYSLKWSAGNESVQALQRFFDSNLTLDSMLDKVREMIRLSPMPCGIVVKFNCQAGLRPTEACESVKLINQLQLNVQPELGSQPVTSNKYYNPQQQRL